MSIFQAIKNDHKAFKNRYNKTPILNINFLAVIIYRLSNYAYKKKLFLISKLFWVLNRTIMSIDIDPGATFGGSLLVIHGIGIVVGRNVVANGDVTIYHGVTIGGNMGKVDYINDTKISQPILHDDIILGPGCKILGPIILGSNTVIGANSVLTKTVGENSLVLGFNKITQK